MFSVLCSSLTLLECIVVLCVLYEVVAGKVYYCNTNPIDRGASVVRPPRRYIESTEYIVVGDSTTVVV